MFELRLMNVNRDIGSFEMFQSTSMIQMQMAHYDCLDVFDIMACLFNLILDLMVFGVFNSGEDVVQRSTPDLWIVLAASGLKEDETFGRMFD